jgi:hypothetical protein
LTADIRELEIAGLDLKFGGFRHPPEAFEVSK